MRSGMSSFYTFLMILVIGVLAYFLGKKNGGKTIDSVAMNGVLIQEIAELSSIELRGTANIKSTNIRNDGSMTDELKKVFLERTFNITIPYIAKYGVDLKNQRINIQQKDKLVSIVLPTPQLLSYELRMDEADAVTRKGLLDNSNDDNYNKIQKKLYTQSRQQLENNQAYIQQSKNKIVQIIQSYYAPMNFKVDVVFKDELKSKVNENIN